MIAGLLAVIAVVGVAGWFLIPDEVPRKRTWVICPGGMTHFDDEVLRVGSPDGDRSHTMCPQCLDYWYEQIEHETPQKQAA